MPEPFLEEAQNDATRLAVQDMERAGVDVITDGEMRRESYSNRFATALDGIDLDEPGVLDRTGHPNPVPRVVGPIRRTRPVEVSDVEFLRSITDRRIKITVPGPFTMTQQAQNDHYPDERSLALAYAEAVNEELQDLKSAGADVVQIDEPYLQARPEPRPTTRSRRSTARSTGSRATPSCTLLRLRAHRPRPAERLSVPERAERHDRDASLARGGTTGLDPEVLRDVGDKTLVLGVLDLGSNVVETPEVVADRIRRALAVVPPERLVVAPDCGMKYLPRERAFQARGDGGRRPAGRTRARRSGRALGADGPRPFTRSGWCAFRSAPSTIKAVVDPRGAVAGLGRDGSPESHAFWWRSSRAATSTRRLAPTRCFKS